MPLLVVLLPLLYPTICRISNDSLGVTLFSGLMLVVLRYFNHQQMWQDAVGIGVLLGLGLLTKAYFLTAVPALAVVLLLAWFSGRSRQRLIAHAVVIGVLAVVISGWWYLRNYTLYGNISGMQELTLTADLSLADRLKAIGRVEWSSSVPAMWKQHIWIGNTSLLALSGTTYQIGYWLILLAIVGAIRSGFRWLRQPTDERMDRPRVRSLAILAAFYGFFVAGVFYHMLVNYVMIGVPDGTGGWYLYAVIVPEVIFLLYGMQGLFRKRAAFVGPAILLLYVFALNFLSLFCKSLPAYAGIFISRFHLSHLFELYSPSGLKTMLTNLAVNKPSFITPAVIGAAIAVYGILLITAIAYVARAAWAARAHAGPANV